MWGRTHALAEDQSPIDNRNQKASKSALLESASPPSEDILKTTNSEKSNLQLNTHQRIVSESFGSQNSTGKKKQQIIALLPDNLFRVKFRSV